MGLSRSGNLMMSLKFTPDRPLLPWQRKLRNVDAKSSVARLE